MRRSPFVRGVLSGAVIASLALTAWATRAAALGLDPSFGDGGRVTLELADTDTAEAANAVALQPDGKILLAGTSQGKLMLARLDTSGALDRTFAGDGVLLTDAQTRAEDLAVQADGSIVVGAGGAIMRFTPTGDPDPSFSGDGIEPTPASPEGTGVPALGSILLRSDGSILVGLRSRDRFLVARYRADGILDDSFGDGGVATSPSFAPAFTSLGISSASPSGLVEAADGRIIVAGTTQEFALHTSGQVGRLAAFTGSGAVDPSFGKGGIVDASTSEYNAVALRPAGDLVVAGTVLEYPTTVEPAIDAFTIDGAVQPAFADRGGYASSGRLYDVVAQPDGGVVAAGTLNGDFGILVLSATGAPVPGPEHGIVTTVFDPHCSTVDSALGVAIQPDGAVVAAGSADGPAAGGPDRVVVARYVAGSADAGGCERPDTKIKGPRKLRTDGGHAVARYRFGSSEPGSQFRCRLRPYHRHWHGALLPCERSPTFELKPGDYELRAAARDADGNLDVTPARRRIAVRAG